MIRSFLRLCVLGCISLALLCGFGCSKKDSSVKPVASSRALPVAAPVGLLAELLIAEPGRVWGTLKKLGGSRAAILPSSWELGLLGVLGVPPRVAGFVRPETRLVGAVLAPNGTAPALVLGFQVTRGAELVAELTKGQAPAFRAEADASRVTVLRGSEGLVLGVVGDWLLVAGDATRLRSAGVYVAEVLAVRPAPAWPIVLDVGREALAGPLSAAVKERWADLRAGLSADDSARRAARGRAPDFGDPSAVLGLADGGVAQLLELLSSARHFRLGLRPEDDRLELSLAIEPDAEGPLGPSLQALAVGGLEPLLGLPQGVVAAALSRSSESERNAAAERPAAALTAVLGSRLAEKDAKALAAALASFHRGRGEATVCGLFADRSAFLLQDAREPRELEQGLLGLLGLLRVPARAEPLAPLVGKVTPRSSSVRVPGVEGPVHRVELVRPTPATPGLEVLLEVRKGTASAVAALRASPALATLTREPGADTLGARPALAKLARGRAPATLALYVDLSLATPGLGYAPVLAVLGRTASEARVEIELSQPACAALVDRLGTP